MAIKSLVTDAVASCQNGLINIAKPSGLGLGLAMHGCGGASHEGNRYKV